MKTDKEIKEIQLRFLEKMKALNYAKWVNEKSNQYGLNLNFSSVSHVAKLISDLTMVYVGYTDRLNPFLKAIYEEELVGACCQADAMNIRALPVYSDFIYNKVPMELRIKK